MGTLWNLRKLHIHPLDWDSAPHRVIEVPRNLTGAVFVHMELQWNPIALRGQYRALWNSKVGWGKTRHICLHVSTLWKLRKLHIHPLDWDSAPHRVIEVPRNLLGAVFLLMELQWNPTALGGSWALFS